MELASFYSYYASNKSLVARILDTSPRSIGRWLKTDTTPDYIRLRLKNLSRILDIDLEADVPVQWWKTSIPAKPKVTYPHKKSCCDNIPSKGTEMISIRIDKRVLEEYRFMGKTGGMPYQAIIKNVLSQRLKEMQEE